MIYIIFSTTFPCPCIISIIIIILFLYAAIQAGGTSGNMFLRIDSQCNANMWTSEKGYIVHGGVSALAHALQCVKLRVPLNGSSRMLRRVSIVRYRKRTAFPSPASNFPANSRPLSTCYFNRNHRTLKLLHATEAKHAPFFELFLGYFRAGFKKKIVNSSLIYISTLES